MDFVRMKARKLVLERIRDEIPRTVRSSFIKRRMEDNIVFSY